MMEKKMKVYVLTDDNTHVVYGVYSSMVNATTALLNVASGSVIISAELQEVGLRVICYNNEIGREYQFYIEFVELDGGEYL